MLLTKPFITKGSHLTLNVVVRGGGEARVAVLHANGEPISGLRLEDCDPLRDDSINQAATWNSGADISKLAGQPIRLRFELKDAELYSFQFATRK
jgi:hypothetical protein